MKLHAPRKHLNWPGDLGQVRMRVYYQKNNRQDNNNSNNNNNTTTTTTDGDDGTTWRDILMSPLQVKTEYILRISLNSRFD